MWALNENGAKLDGIELRANAVVRSGYNKPSLVAGEEYTPRKGY